MELVTGKAGTPHVSSADDGRRIAGEVGMGNYVLQTGGKLAPSLVDSNHVRFATGDLVVQGRHIGVTEPEDVAVASGTQGKKRMDYICVHYTKDVSGSAPTLVEKVEWTVLQGTPGDAATAPDVPAGSILNGDADVTVPIASVTFDGLMTGEPKLLVDEIVPLADMWDSVSQDTGWVDLYRDSKFGSVSYRAKDGVCTLIVVALWGIPANSFWTLPKQIPTKYLPPQGCYSALTYRQSNNIASAWIPGQNSADMNEYIYTTVATTATSTAIHGMISWVY